VVPDGVHVRCLDGAERLGDGRLGAVEDDAEAVAFSELLGQGDQRIAGHLYFRALRVAIGLVAVAVLVVVVL